MYRCSRVAGEDSCGARPHTQCSQIAALLDCCPSLSVLQLIFSLLLSSSKSYHAGIEVATTIDSDERGGRAEIIHVRNELSCTELTALTRTVPVIRHHHAAATARIAWHIVCLSLYLSINAFEARCRGELTDAPIALHISHTYLYISHHTPHTT